MEVENYKKYYQENIKGSNFKLNSHAQPWHTDRLEKVAEIINKENFNSILDLGSGRGDIFDMVGISNKYSIEINHDWHDHLTTKGVEIINDDVFALINDDFNCRADCVVATEFFEHFPYYDLLPLLRALHKRINSKLIISVPNPVSLLARTQTFLKGNFSYAQVSLDHAFMQDVHGWSRLFENVGFTVLQTFGVGMKIPKPWGGVWYSKKPLRKSMADYLIFVCSKK
ncbi:methyltransferase domain-containing protein [Candidatus Uhrbacteria bacterium]|nr:methyltransferase domain-containing protein [Candidatus Uhrbacteria bacterium]